MGGNVPAALGADEGVGAVEKNAFQRLNQKAGHDAVEIGVETDFEIKINRGVALDSRWVLLSFHDDEVIENNGSTVTPTVLFAVVSRTGIKLVA